MNMNGMAGGMPQARPSGAQNGGNSQFNQYILQQIAMQGVPQGWQTQIDRGNRFTTITTLYTSLRLASHASGTPQPDQQLLNSAIQSERDAFNNASGPSEYHERLKQRLATLQRFREQNSRNMGLNNPNASMSGPTNHMMQRTPGFNQNVQQPPPQMSMQMPMQSNPSGIMAGATPTPSNVSMFQRQPANSQQAPMFSQPTMANHQARPPTNINNDQLNALINQSLQEAQANGRLDSLRQQARVSFPAHLLSAAHNRGWDPAVLLIRQGILSRMQANGANGGVSTAPLPGSHMNNPNTPNFSANQNKPVSVPARPQTDSKTPVDYKQIVNQQANARQVQDNGDVVVPASNNKAYQGKIGQGLSGLGGMTGPSPIRPVSVPVPNHDPNQPNANPFSGVPPAQGKQPKFSNQPTPTPQQQLANNANNAFPNQSGSLNTSQPLPGHSPLPNLNKPHEPNGVPHNNSGASRPARQAPSSTPNMPFNSQAPGPTSNSFQAPNGQQIQTPMNFRQQVMSLPPEQRQKAIEMLRAQLQLQGNPALLNGRLNNFVQPPVNLSNLGPGVAQQPLLNTSGAPVNPNSQPSIQPPGNLANRQANMQLPDRMQLPHEKLNNELRTLDIPGGVNTWGELRNFLHRNPKAISTEDEAKLWKIQRAQFQHQYLQRNRVNGPWVDIPADKMHLLNGLVNNNILEVQNSQARIKDMTIQDLQLFRTRNPSTTPDGRLPDGQAKSKIMFEKLQQVKQILGAEFGERLRAAYQQGAQQNQNAAGQQQPRTFAANGNGSGVTAGMVANGINQSSLSQMQPSIPPQAPMQSPSAKPTNSLGISNMPNGVAPQAPMTSTANGAKPKAAEQQARVPATTVPKSQPNTEKDASHTVQHPQSQVQPQAQTLEMRERRFHALAREAESKHSRTAPIQLTREEQIQVARAVSAVGNKAKILMGLIRAFYLRTGKDDLTFQFLEAIFIFKNQLNPQANVQGKGQQPFSFSVRPADIQAPFMKLQQLEKMMSQRSNNSLGETGSAPNATGGAAASTSVTLSQPTGNSLINKNNNDNSSSNNNNNNNNNSAKAAKNAQTTLSNDSRPINSTASQPARNTQMPMMAQPRPDGTVKYLNEDKFSGLVFPAERLKKRQSLPPNQAAEKMTTPVAAATMKEDPTTRPTSTPTPAVPIKVDLPFKCFEPGCEYHTTGFASEEEQRTHQETEHGYTGTPKQWCLDQMKKALGLDKPAKQFPGQYNNVRPQVKDGGAMEIEPRSSNAQQEVSGRATPVRQPRPTSIALARPSGASNQAKRDSSAIGATDSDGSPPKRSRSVPPSPAELWREASTSKAVLTHIFNDCPRASEVDPFGGAEIVALDDRVSGSPAGGGKEQIDKGGDGADYVLVDSDQSLRASPGRWSDVPDEEFEKGLFTDGANEVIASLFDEQEREQLPFAIAHPEQLPKDVDWRVASGVVPYDPGPNPAEMITSEQLAEFMKMEEEG